MASCLTPAQIEGLLAGTLSAQEQRQAEEHVAGCETCRRQVEARRTDEKLFGQIKEARQDETLLPPASPGGAAQADPLVGEPIEGYEILREIHRGGQGIVYKARQKATKRTVALKVLLQGPYASPAQRRRFEREIDLVASLQHPNIVTIYESGQTKEGRHYFAMEYIHGQPLDEFLKNVKTSKSQKVEIEELLRLFQKICAAVNHAHQHGVIHRDLKPGNILVDADGQPHVVDFGLAKPAGLELHDGAPMTVTGEFMGTLAYASPEQTKGDPNLIDIRTDVYSLGVILYEMLTGKYPYPVVGQMGEVLRHIAETVPTKPSTVRWQINDEVETIVLKALAKEMDRRYPSAEALGRDVERYLTGDAIEAKRDSAWYVLRKSLRRYRKAAAVAAAFVALLTTSSVVSTVLWRRAVAAEQQQSKERLRAEAERQRADQQRRAAEQAREKAEFATYVANIHVAQIALDHNERAALRRALDDCPAGLRGWEWRYLDARSDQSLFVLRGHAGEVNSAAFSRDGTRIVTGSADATARVWDAATRKELAVLRGHAGVVNSAAFSPDETRIVTGSEDKTTRVWEAATGKKLTVLREHRRDVTSAAFSPDGTRIVTASGDRTTRLWEAAMGKELDVFREHAGRLNSAAFSPDGTRIVTASVDKTARVWEAATGKQLAVFLGHEAQVNSAGFSPDGTRIVTASSDKTARLWDAATEAELAELRGHEGWVHSAAFSPDGTRIVTASYDETARLWEAATGKEMVVLRGHEGPVHSAAFSPDGTRIMTGSFDGTARVWAATTTKVPIELRGHADGLLSAAFSPDGTRIVTGSADRTARVWEAATGKELAVLRGHEDRVTSAVFSPDGTRIVTACEDKIARVWDASSGKELPVLGRHDRDVRTAAFSPDGSRIVTGSGDKTARVWEAATGKQLAVLRGHAAAVYTAMFSRDGMRIVTGSQDRTARLWNAATGKELSVMPGHHGEVLSAAFSPDGKRIVTGCDDKTARLWEAATGKELAVLRGHEGRVQSAAFSPDGTRIVTASYDDKTARVWEAETGKELVVLRGHEGWVFSAAFSPDGTRIVTGSDDKTARVWDTVPYRQRRIELDDLARVRPKAERMVDVALQAGTEPEEAARAIRANVAISETLRRVALDVLLERSSRFFNEARVRFELLQREHVSKAQVTKARIVAALQSDRKMPTRMKAEVRRLAENWTPSAVGLYELAWPIVVRPDCPPERVAGALEAAEEAVLLDCDRGMIVKTLGVAQYRAGRFGEALKTLSRSRDLLYDEHDQYFPADLAFIAMSQFRLGRRNEAAGSLARLREMMKRDENAKNEMYLGFLREAERLIEGPTTSQAATSQPEAAVPHEATTQPTTGRAD